MANSILSSLFSQANFSLAKATGGAVATNLKVISVKTKFSSTVFGHMREDGVTLVDARVIKATRLTVECIVPDLDTLSQITQVAMDRVSLYTIKSKGLVFNNMRVDEDNISQIPKMLSASPLKIVFKEQLVQYVQPVIFAQSADSSLISQGIVALQSVTTTASNLYSSLTSAF